LARFAGAEHLRNAEDGVPYALVYDSGLSPSFFFILRVFQANKQQQLGLTYLHQDQPKGWSFFLVGNAVLGVPQCA
jgi:hypothetical protein